MNSFTQWLQQLQLGSAVDLVTVVAASLLCITFHETSHGRVAYWLGDPTAKNMGRLSMNPIKHIDLLGLIMMAVFKFGWAKPVPIDMRYFKKPKRDMALTALAGPVSNLILAMAALLFRAVLMFFYTRSADNAVLDFVINFTEYTAVLSVGLAVFNIIPISPLDGSKVFFSFLSDRAYNRLMRYERYGMFLLMALLFLGVLDTPLTFLRSGVLTALAKITWFPYTILTQLFG